MFKSKVAGWIMLSNFKILRQYLLLLFYSAIGNYDNNKNFQITVSSSGFKLKFVEKSKTKF